MNSEPIFAGSIPLSDDAGLVPKLTDGISLSLEDLLPDSGGSIVIKNDDGDLSIRLVTDQLVVEQGFIDRMVTAAGEDVSGHAFFAFSDGLTIYYPTAVHLSVVALDE